MTNSQDYVDRLLGKGYLEAFESDELERLIDACHSKVYVSGEALWAAGDSRNKAFILVSGRIERKIRLTGNRRNEQYQQPGHILALSALVSDWTFHSSAYALERSELLLLETEAFQNLLEAEDSAAYKLVDQIAAYLVRDMREANARAQEVFGQPAETLRMLRRRIREDSKA